MSYDLREELAGAGLLEAEKPLHRVWHFGKEYQWFRKADGQHVMRPYVASSLGDLPLTQDTIDRVMAKAREVGLLG